MTFEGREPRFREVVGDDGVRTPAVAGIACDAVFGRFAAKANIAAIETQMDELRGDGFDSRWPGE